jgi:hypothetical protein
MFQIKSSSLQPLDYIIRILCTSPRYCRNSSKKEIRKESQTLSLSGCHFSDYESTARPITTSALTVGVIDYLSG